MFCNFYFTTGKKKICFLIFKMKAQVRETSQQCACIPTWLRAPTDEGKTCFFCTKEFTKDEARFLCYWMYSCCSSQTRVHAVGHALHDECTRPYQEHLERMDYLRFIYRCPISPLHLSPDRVDKMRLDCRTKHKPLGTWCDNCHVAHQEGTKFFRCMACHAVHYCSVACQRANWANHKEFCRAKSSSDPEIGLPDKNPKEACSCLTEKERIMHEREGTGLCSNSPCSNCVFPPYVLSFCMTQCTKNQGKWHFISTQYCTVDCREANM